MKIKREKKAKVAGLREQKKSVSDSHVQCKRLEVLSNYLSSTAAKAKTLRSPGHVNAN